jgi:Uma2 family endonuclease
MSGESQKSIEIMGVAEKLLHSIVDYLTYEDESQEKYEYQDGHIVSMAGGTANHS